MNKDKVVLAGFQNDSASEALEVNLEERPCRLDITFSCGGKELAARILIENSNGISRLYVWDDKQSPYSHVAQLTPSGQCAENRPSHSATVEDKDAVGAQSP